MKIIKKPAQGGFFYQYNLTAQEITFVAVPGIPMLIADYSGVPLHDLIIVTLR